MKPENFTEFLIRQGHRIVKTESCFWYDAQIGFFFQFPYHKLVSPSKAELEVLFKNTPCFGTRYFTPWNNIGKESYLIVCSDKNYDFTSTDANYARRQTRRGVENFDIKQIDFKYLADNGIKIVHETLARQCRDLRIWTEKNWRLYCTSADGIDGFEAWGAFKENTLAAFIIGFQCYDCFNILHHSSSTEYLKQYINNALVYSLTKLKLADNDIAQISYGPESLDAPESLDKFKFRMGYQKFPMKQRIIFNPLIKPFINTYSYKIVQKLSEIKPESDTLRKADGIIRFYLEAK